MSFTSKAQENLIRDFGRFEIQVSINGLKHSYDIISTNCRMKFNYKSKSFTFRCMEGSNTQPVYRFYDYLETINGRSIVCLFNNLTYKFQVNDLLNEKGQIEFVHTYFLESGEEVIEIHRFRNI